MNAETETTIVLRLPQREAAFLRAALNGVSYGSGCPEGWASAAASSLGSEAAVLTGAEVAELNDVIDRTHAALGAALLEASK